MAFPQHRRLSFRGIFGTATAPWEEWQFRLNLAPGDGTDDLEAIAQAGLDAFTTHMAPKIRDSARLTEVKAASIDEAGLYTSDPAILAADVVGAGTGGGYMPPQVALAVSLVTERRGPTGRGRFFLPAPIGAPESSTGLMLAATAQGVADNAAAFLGAINGPAGFGNVAVVSSKGYLSIVTEVRVGRAYDTIRRRRNGLDEVYGTEVTVTS